MNNMFTYASRYKRLGVDRVYSYNFFGIENGTAAASDARSTRASSTPTGRRGPCSPYSSAEAAAFSR